MNILIEVKRKHIREGKRCDNSYCPLCLAIKEKVPKWTIVRVLESIAVVGVKNNKCARVSLPRSAQRFTSGLDNRGKKAVKPFNFILKGV